MVHKFPQDVETAESVRRIKVTLYSPIKDLHPRRGVPHARCTRQRQQTRYIPLHASTQELLNDYLVEHATPPTLTRPLPTREQQSYRRTGQHDARDGVHALRATAATNALDHEADIAKVQEWLGHANIATTRIYDRRKMKPKDSPTF
jgi:integrase